MDWKKELMKDLLNEDAEHSENDDNSSFLKKTLTPKKFARKGQKGLQFSTEFVIFYIKKAVEK